MQAGPDPSIPFITPDSCLIRGGEGLTVVRLEGDRDNPGCLLVACVGVGKGGEGKYEGRGSRLGEGGREGRRRKKVSRQERS